MLLIVMVIICFSRGKGIFNYNFTDLEYFMMNTNWI